MRCGTCISLKVSFQIRLSTPVQDYQIKGLRLTLNIISDNGLTLYMHRVYWEGRGKSDTCSLNIFSG